MKAVTRTTAALLIVLTLLGLVPSPVRADHIQLTNADPLRQMEWVNPLDGDLPADEPEGGDGELMEDPGETVFSTEEAIASFRQHFVNRDGSFSVTVPMPEGDLGDYTWYLVRHAMDHTGVPDEGDYIYGQFVRISWHSEQTEEELTVTVTASYRASRSKEDQVDQKVAQIISELDLPRENDYETFRAVYDYLTSHVTYDTANPAVAHTAYGALVLELAVCQGFAVALYRLCLEAGIDCRYSVSTAQHHAWNIVGLGGEYYLVDSTWDRVKDEDCRYRYCLNGTQDWLTKHFTTSNTALPSFGDGFVSKNDPYGNPEAPWFDPVDQYPMSYYDFEEGRHLLTVDYVYPDGTQAAEPYSSLVWACEDYDVPVPEIEGYVPSRNEISGSMAGHDLAITVEYLPEGHVHEWDGGTVTTDATCTDCGTKTFSCSCGATKTEKVAPKSHSVSNGTCTRCGAAISAYGSGYIRGGKAKWALETDGKLTVYGIGIMGVLTSNNLPPWQSHAEEITSLEIKEGITTISALAFDGCVNLASVSLPEGLVTICGKAFNGCSSLTDIELPDSVQYVDKYAFQDAGLTSLSLGTGAYYFGFDCFAGNEGLDEVSFAGTLERWCYADIKNKQGDPGWCASSFTVNGQELTGDLEIPEPVKKIRSYTLANKGLTWVGFPETLEELEGLSLIGNGELDELTFTGDCPAAGENVIDGGSFDIHYPCGTGTWTEESMEELSSEAHMPGCSVKGWHEDHLWDNGTAALAGEEVVIRYACRRCGLTRDEELDPDKTGIVLNVVWNDADDQDGIRPSGVEMFVEGRLADGTLAVQPFRVAVTAADGWVKAVANLAKNGPEGEQIIYRIKYQKAVSGYTSSISGLTVTDRHVPRKTSIELEVIWEDEDDAQRIRPDTVCVTLMGTVDGHTVFKKDFKISEKEKWTLSVTGLDQYHAGKRIQYAIAGADSVGGYNTYFNGTDVFYTLEWITHASFKLEAKGSSAGADLFWSADRDYPGVTFEIYRREVGSTLRKQGVSKADEMQAKGDEWIRIGETAEMRFTDAKTEPNTVYEYQIRVTRGDVQGRSNKAKVTASGPVNIIRPIPFVPPFPGPWHPFWLT